MLNIFKKISICFLLLGMLLIQVANPFGKSSIVSLGTWTIFLATFSCLVYIVLTKKLDNLSFICLLGMFILSILSMLFNDSFSFDSMVSIMCFLEIPIFLCFIEDMGIKNLRKSIYIVFVALSLFYIFLSFLPFSHEYKNNFGITTIKELTLGYRNPNEVAVYLFIDFIIIVIAFLDFKNKLIKTFLLVDLCYIFYLINLTGSRTIIILAVFFVLFTILYRNRKIGAKFVLFSLLMPLLFILLLKVFGEKILLGEFIETGRLEIYARVLENINILKLFFGYVEGGFTNYHNIYISIFSLLGVLGLVLYVSLIYFKIKQLLESANNRTNVLAILGVLFLIISSSAESALFVAGSVFAASVISVFLLSIPNQEEI